MIIIVRAELVILGVHNALFLLVRGQVGLVCIAAIFLVPLIALSVALLWKDCLIIMLKFVMHCFTSLK